MKYLKLKIMAFILALVVCVSSLSALAFAAQPGKQPANQQTQQLIKKKQAKKKKSKNNKAAKKSTNKKKQSKTKNIVKSKQASQNNL